MKEMYSSINSELTNKSINTYDRDNNSQVNNVIEMRYLDEAQKNFTTEDNSFFRKRVNKPIIKSRQDFLDISRLERKGDVLKERLIRDNNEDG